MSYGYRERLGTINAPAPANQPGPNVSDNLSPKGVLGDIPTALAVWSAFRTKAGTTRGGKSSTGGRATYRRVEHPN